jgi:hypothetical protein
MYSDGEPQQEAQVADVSLSGLALSAEMSHPPLPPVGTRLYLEFSLPTDREVPIMAIGTVVWSHSQERQAAGVRILKLFPAGQMALRSFVQGARRKSLNYSLV